MRSYQANTPEGATTPEGKSLVLVLVVCTDNYGSCEIRQSNSSKANKL